jgi:hypothetical protein
LVVVVARNSMQALLTEVLAAAAVRWLTPIRYLSLLEILTLSLLVMVAQAMEPVMASLQTLAGLPIFLQQQPYALAAGRRVI